MKFDILVILFYIFFCGMGAWIGAAVGLSSAAIVCYALGIAEANIAFIVWPCVLFFCLLGLFIGLGPAYAVHLIYQFIFDHLLPTLFTVDFHKEQKQD
ncbi:hypothetical protein [Phascolarctobacterium succinatutens]